MPAFNFKQRWADKVERGEKRQTIRAPRADHRAHASVGAKLMLYTGMRHKSCRKLLDAICTDYQQVVITDNFRIIVAGVPVEDEDAFAVADGFTDRQDFFDFFNNTHGLPFEGSLIKWSPDAVD